MYQNEVIIHITYEREMIDKIIEKLCFTVSPVKYLEPYMAGDIINNICSYYYEQPIKQELIFDKSSMSAIDPDEYLIRCLRRHQATKESNIIKEHLRSIETKQVYEQKKKQLEEKKNKKRVHNENANQIRATRGLPPLVIP